MIIGVSKAQIFRNISAVLEAAGSSLEKLLKVNVFLTNMDDFAAVNEVYAQYLNFEPKPVTCFLSIYITTIIGH